MKCARCLGGHETASHDKLEETFMRYENWAIGSGTRLELGLPGVPGGPSRLGQRLFVPGTPEVSPAPDHVPLNGVALDLPDRLRIVRCTIGAVGWDAESLPGAGILRQWRRDPGGGFTFMLSCDRLMEGEKDSLEALFGDRGSTVMVDVRFSRTTSISERYTT